METLKTESSNRLVFLDNLRSLFVICVVLTHSGCAYTVAFFNKWWSVPESDSSMIVALIVNFFGVFQMPLLFYIAGYFAIPSIQKRGAWLFIKGKLKRLGIPWIICMLTICPVYLLIYHYTRDGMILTNSYADLWMDLMRNAARFDIGFIGSMDELIMNNGFFQRYMWFLSLLILFFFILSLVFKAKQTWFTKNYPVNTESPSIASTVKLLIIVSFMSFMSSMIISGVVFAVNKNADPLGWFTLGNIIQFQPILLTTYIIFFCIGIITYRNKWIERGIFPGHTKTWAISFVVLLVIFSVLIYAYFGSMIESNEKVLYGMISLPLRHLLIISTLGFFSSLAMKYWNKRSMKNRGLAPTSYAIYLSHYIFVIGFQLILFTIPGIPPLIKFTIVSVSSLTCAYIISRFLIKPFPKVTALLSFSILIAMFMLIRV